MRQRGPTATALSPGLYIDANKMLGSCNISPVSPIGDSTVVSPLTSGMYAPRTMSPNLIGISPVLTRTQSPPLKQSHSQSDVYAPNHCNQKVLNQGMIPKSGRDPNDPYRKLQKKHKTGRAGLSQANGEMSRNLHSLKMTIRRTSQAHKVHPSVCSVVDLPESINSCSVPCTTAAHHSNTLVQISPSHCAMTVEQDHSPSIVCGKSNMAPSPCTKTDACTSTLTCATITEPDLLGPCQAGTKVVVEGIVWLETTGMLVLNIKWRGRAYMGTLLDASKQSFGHSCPDKGIVSALSLLNGRRAWPHGSPGRFRARGLHHFHHHHHHHRTVRHRHHTIGASMTTRSAAAAAAASTQPTDSIESLEPELDEQHLKNHENAQPDLSVYDIDASHTPESYISSGSQRGTKRRRRRGAGVGRPYRRVTAKLNAESIVPTFVSPEQPINDRSPLSEKPNGVDTCVSDPSSSLVPFSCPYPGCKKEFPDLLSMRYHFSMGHMNHDQSLESSSVNPSPPKQLPLVDATSGDASADVPSIEESSRISPQRPPAQSSPPPTLGRAHNMKELTDEHGFCITTLDDGRFDDNLAPPRLHRIVSITDSVNGFSENRNISSPSKQTRSPSPNDEPPAPSPAYSDISDDGTVPAELQDSSFTADSPGRQLSSMGQTKLFTPGQALLSPLTGSLVSRRATGFEFKCSPSIASPVLTHSPTMRHGVQNGFYFPVSILPQVVPAPHSPSAVVSSSNSVMSSLSVVTNPMDRGSGDHLPGRGLSPSLPLSTYAPITQATYLLPTPSPTIGASHFVPTSHTVCIPGVNSFSIPPTLTAVTNECTLAASISNVSMTHPTNSSVLTSARLVNLSASNQTSASAILSQSKPLDGDMHRSNHHVMRFGSGSVRRPHNSDLHSSILGLSSLAFRSDSNHIRTQVGVSSTGGADSVER